MTSLIPDDLFELDDMVQFISLISDWSFATGDTTGMTDAEVDAAILLAQEQALISGFEGLRTKKMDMIKQKKMELDKLSLDRTRMDSKILHVSESSRKRQIEYESYLEEYIKHNVDIAYGESKIELKTNDIMSKTNAVENILDYRSDNINCKRDEMQTLIDEYRDCREEFQQYQQELADKTDQVRKEVLISTTLCKRAQAAIVSEVRKTAPNASQNPHNKFLQANISEIGERTNNSRNDLKKYCVSKIMEMRRTDRIAQEKEEETIKRRMDELNNPDRDKIDKNKVDEKNGDDDASSSEDDFFDGPRKEAEKRLENPGIAESKDKESKKGVIDAKDKKKGMTKGGKNTTKFANLAKKPPLLATANYLGNFIDESSPQHDNLLEFLQDCGEAENAYFRLLAIKKGLQSHVVQQACVLSNALTFFENCGFERSPTTKAQERERVTNEYLNNIQFGHLEPVLSDYIFYKNKSSRQPNHPGSPSREGSPGRKQKDPRGHLSASPESSKRNMSQIEEGYSLQNSSTTSFDVDKSKTTMADILFMESNDTKNSIGFNLDEVENMDTINIQELFKETDNIESELNQVNFKIMNKLSSKKLLDLAQYEEWLATNDKGRFSFFGDDANMETPRVYFTTETERRLFDVPLEEDSEWRSRIKASTKTKEVNEKTIKSTLRKGNGLRSFIKVLFESAGVNFDRNAQVNYNSKGKKGSDTNDITDLNIEAGFVKLASVMDSIGYQLRSHMDQLAKKKKGKDEHNDPNKDSAMKIDVDLVHDPKMNTRKLSVTNLSYI